MRLDGQGAGRMLDGTGAGRSVTDLLTSVQRSAPCLRPLPSLPQ